MFVFGKVDSERTFHGTRSSYRLVCRQTEMNGLDASATIWEMAVLLKGTLAVLSEQHKLQYRNPPALFP